MKGVIFKYTDKEGKEVKVAYGSLEDAKKGKSLRKQIKKRIIMGCRHACICTGFCPGCRNYEPEQYWGEAEDLFAQSRGYDSYEQEIEENRQEHDELNKINYVQQKSMAE